MITKTAIGNYLRKQPNGDVGMYRNGFKDGVAWALAQQGEQQPVAWYEYNQDLDAWFLAYGHNPKAKTRPLVFGDTAAPAPQAQPVAAQGERTARDAFEAFAKQYDTFGNEWQDMGADDYFIAGYKAALQSTQPAKTKQLLEKFDHLTDDEILEIAHRKATRYTHAVAPGQITYGFTVDHAVDFARAIEKASE